MKSFVATAAISAVILVSIGSRAAETENSVLLRPFPPVSTKIIGDMFASDAEPLDETAGSIDSEEAVSDWVDELLATEDEEWTVEVDEEQSVLCEPDTVHSDSRRALGILLRDTPADLRGTSFRAPWFQAFPWTQSFPEAAEMSGALYRYSHVGTVGLLIWTRSWMS